jgi:hypothetical protein
MDVMDIVVIAIASTGILVAIATAIAFFIRWRRNRYRFSLRAMFFLVTLVGCVIFATMRFVVPIVSHRWAVQNIYSSGGGLLFRDDYEPDSGQIYSDPRKANPWREVLIVHISNDGEAVAAAKQLKHLPEVECLFLGAGVSDKGLAAICDSGSSVDTLNLLQSPVTAAGLSRLASLEKLHTLFFNSCPINDADLVALKLLRSLRNLTLLEEGPQANPNLFTDAGFSELGQIKMLERLWLVRQTISDSAADHLKDLTNLKVLQLSRCQISDQAVADLRKALPDCDVKIFTN